MGSLSDRLTGTIDGIEDDVSQAMSRPGGARVVASRIAVLEARVRELESQPRALGTLPTCGHHAAVGGCPSCDIFQLDNCWPDDPRSVMARNLDAATKCAETLKRDLSNVREHLPLVSNPDGVVLTEMYEEDGLAGVFKAGYWAALVDVYPGDVDSDATKHVRALVNEGCANLQQEREELRAALRKLAEHHHEHGVRCELCRVSWSNPSFSSHAPDCLCCPPAPTGGE